MFKKIGTILLIGIISLSLSGCGKNKNVEGDLQDLMTKIYQDIPSDKLPISMDKIEITEDNIEAFLGTKDIEYKEALASEPMVSSIAHSVILIRTKENADIEKIKKTIKENINPRKWICVWVEDEDVIIKNKGDLIIVIVVEDPSNRSALEKGFDEL